MKSHKHKILLTFILIFNYLIHYGQNNLIIKDTLYISQKKSGIVLFADDSIIHYSFGTKEFNITHNQPTKNTIEFTSIKRFDTNNKRDFETNLIVALQSGRVYEAVILYDNEAIRYSKYIPNALSEIKKKLETTAAPKTKQENVAIKERQIFEYLSENYVQNAFNLKSENYSITLQLLSIYLYKNTYYYVATINNNSNTTWKLSKITIMVGTKKKNKNRNVENDYFNPKYDDNFFVQPFSKKTIIYSSTKFRIDKNRFCQIIFSESDGIREIPLEMRSVLFNYPLNLDDEL